MVLNSQGGRRYYPATATADGLLKAADFARLAAIYQNTPSCVVTHSANQSIANNTVSTQAWNGEVFDTHGFHDNATNNSRLTIPSGLDGLYVAMVWLTWDAGALGNFYVDIITGGGTIYGMLHLDLNASADGRRFNVTTVPMQMAATNYVQVNLYQRTGGAVNTLNPGNGHFGIFRLGGY